MKLATIHERNEQRIVVVGRHETAVFHIKRAAEREGRQSNPFERGLETGRFLQDGDTVEPNVEKIDVLRNRVEIRT